MDIYKNRILDTAQAIIDMANEIESLKTENKELRDRLIHAQSETLAAIQKTESKPEPRDIGHENVVSWVVRKSGELQVSHGIVWGLIMDLISKNSDDFGMGSDASEIEPYTEPDADDNEPPLFMVGDRVVIIGTCPNSRLIGKTGTIQRIVKDAKYPIQLVGYNVLFSTKELKLINRP
jgi:hypothetical protein